MLGDSFFLIKNFIREILKVSYYWVLIKSILVSNEPFDLIIFSNSFLWGLETTSCHCNKKKKNILKEFKKDSSIHMSSQGKQAFLREIPAGLLWFQRKHAIDLFMRMYGFTLFRG